MADEAKRDVEILHERGCRGCVVKEVTTCVHREKGEYCNNFYHEIADLIESLSAELEQVKQERDESNRILAQVRAALESSIVERDQREIVKSCDNCTQAEQFWNPNCSIEYCRDCRDFSKWKYNGVKE